MRFGVLSRLIRRSRVERIRVERIRSGDGYACMDQVALRALRSLQRVMSCGVAGVGKSIADFS